LRHLLYSFCSECENKYTDDKRYKYLIYFGTSYEEFIPELPNWKCPEHPEAPTIRGTDYGVQQREDGTLTGV
jgi:hypothetical protein